MYPDKQFTFAFFVGSVFISLVSVQGSRWHLWSYSESEAAVPAALSRAAATSDTDGVVTESVTVPRILQNFDVSINKYIVKNVIPLHQKTSHVYLMMASYFGRSDVALPGFAKYFRSASERELANVNFLMNYLNKRGAVVWLKNIPGVKRTQWVDGLTALENALTLEKDLNKQLLLLATKVSKNDDFHFNHVVEDRFLEPKVSTIKELGDNIAVLSRMKGANYGLSEYLFDKNL